MKHKKSFDPAVLAQRIYKARGRLYKRIRNKSAIERYLISVRSRDDFVAFYKVRLQKKHAGQLYRYLLRHMAFETCPTITTALRTINGITSSIELSQASKVIASLNRKKPVYDSVVRRHLKLSHPGGDLKRAIEIYAQLLERMSALLREADVSKAIREFNREFPQFSRTIFLTKMKKLDLLLWQLK